MSIKKLINREIQFSNGNSIDIDKELLLYIWKYIGIYVFLHIKNVYSFLKWSSSKQSIYFYPRNPKGFYSIYNIVKYSCLKFEKDSKKASVIFNFDDHTFSNQIEKRFSFANQKIINNECTDISKEHVAYIFESIFGYPLTVNPLKYVGNCVLKSNVNGAHDGKIISCPIDKKDMNYSYQKLIDNSTPDGHVYDIRCPIIGDNIPFIYIKKRPLISRFSNNNSSVEIQDTKNQLSENEIQKILEFCKAIGLDFGEIDILRDNSDKLIYIVDVNKTALGPPVGFKYREKIRILEIMSSCFKKEFL